MKKRLIFVNRYFFPDESATSQILSDLAFSLYQGEFVTEVIASRQLIDDPNAELPYSEVVKGVRIHRVWTSRLGRSNLLGRAIDYLTFYLSATLKLAFRVRRGDVIVAKTDPPLIGFPAAIIAQVKGGSLINWWQDVYPEVAEQLGVSAVRWFGRPLRWMRRAACRAAVENVAIGRCMKDLLVATGAPAEKVVVIPNWVDDEAIRPLPPGRNKLRHDWGLTDAFVVGYSGNMGRGHEFDALLAAATALAEDSRVRFLFIGSGARKAEIEAQVAREEMGNVSFRPFQPRSLLPMSLTAPDVHVISLRPSLAGLIVPSKVYGALAAGRPLIYMGPRDSEIGRVIEDYQCGFVCDDCDSEGIRMAIEQLAGDSALMHQQGLNARRAVDEKFSKSLSIEAWTRLLESVAAS